VLFTICELSRKIRDREISPVELTHHCLVLIEKLNPALNAYITVTAESALERARLAEREIFRGAYLGPLHGIPIGLKDIIDVAGVRTTAASAQFKDRVPSEDAEAVRRLRCGGAVFLGKQNLHEFAYGGSSIISCFGEVHNPWNTTRVAGGSSGGSAASVAAALDFAAVGTDTAGSIRLPAAYCGVVGLKPTYGRVSTRGVIPLSPSLDHIGPIANSVYDVALMLQVMTGRASADPCAEPSFISAFDELPPNLRVGVPESSSSTASIPTLPMQSIKRFRSSPHYASRFVMSNSKSPPTARSRAPKPMRITNHSSSAHPNFISPRRSLAYRPAPTSRRTMFSAPPTIFVRDVRRSEKYSMKWTCC